MSEIPGENQIVREVSVDELECYMNRLESRLEDRSSFTILKISFSRLKIQDLDAKDILKGMLRFFEAAQKGDASKNDVYRELLNLYDELFLDPSADGLPTEIPPSVGYPPRSSRELFSGYTEVQGGHMNPTIKPPEFAGGSIKAMVSTGMAGMFERSKAETMRPSQEPEASSTADPTADPTDDINSRETQPDIDRKELALMHEMLARERRLRKIFALDDGAAGTIPTAGTVSVGEGSEIPEIETGETDLADFELPENEDPR